MEKIQEKNTKRFLIGITLIILSSVIGWVGVFACNALALKFGRKWAVTGFIIYAVSWIPFGLGFLLAGKEGISYAKSFFRRIFRCGK